MTGRRHQRFPRRRFTLWAAVYFGVGVVLPVLTVCTLLDYGLYRLAKTGAIPCVSIFCLAD